MLGRIFHQLKLETKLGLLTGILFFVPLLFTSVSINRFITQEHNALYAERALKTASALARSPLAAKALEARAQNGDPTPLLKSLFERANANAVHIRYLALASHDGHWSFYPQQEERISAKASRHAETSGPVRFRPDEIAPGLFQTPMVAVEVSAGPGGGLALGFASGDMEDLVSHFALPLQKMMLAFMLLGLLLAAFLAQSIKKILLGLEPEEIATLLQERNAMLGIMTEGVIAINPRGKVTLVNEEAARILALADIPSSPDDDELAQISLVQRLRDIARSGESERNLEQNLNGVTVLANYRPVKVGGSIAGAVVTFRDMSEVRQLAESITDINRYVDALRSQSHEFMNKLHVIMGLVNNGKSGELRSYIEELVESGTQEGRAIHDAIKDPLIAGFLASKYSHAREMGVRLRFVVTGILPPLEDGALRNGLVTILGNLIDNAIDAVQNRPEQAVSVTLNAGDRDLTITVTDTGCGIAEEDRELIFTKSHSSKGPKRGLGLWLVRKSVESQNGSVSLESQMGEGSVFTVSLPLPPIAGDSPC